jgi:hypothetical protein
VRSLRGRFWIESILGAATAVLAALTLVMPDWLEEMFGLDPDAADGSVERLIVLGLAAATVVLAALATTEWKRANAPASGG